MAFPTLTQGPNTPIKETPEDQSIKSTSEAGYVHARERYTRIRRTFALSYKNLSNTDKVALDGHCDTVGSVTPFTWVHPISGTTYTVRYEKRLAFESCEHDGTGYRWNTDFNLVQV